MATEYHKPFEFDEDDDVRNEKIGNIYASQQMEYSEGIIKNDMDLFIREIMNQRIVQWMNMA